MRKLRDFLLICFIGISKNGHLIDSDFRHCIFFDFINLMHPFLWFSQQNTYFIAFFVSAFVTITSIAKSNDNLVEHPCSMLTMSQGIIGCCQLLQHIVTETQSDLYFPPQACTFSVVSKMANGHPIAKECFVTGMLLPISILTCRNSTE